MQERKAEAEAVVDQVERRRAELVVALEGARAAIAEGETGLALLRSAIDRATVQAFLGKVREYEARLLETIEKADHFADSIRRAAGLPPALPREPLVRPSALH